MTHTCHWPDCNEIVPPKMWGCRKHWFALPKELRDRIWRTYVPGQEVTKTPSAEYLAAARDVQEWIQQKYSTAGTQIGSAVTPDELFKMLESCVERGDDGRYYPTPSGCERLQKLLAERGLHARVSISRRRTFEISLEG